MDLLFVLGGMVTVEPEGVRSLGEVEKMAVLGQQENSVSHSSSPSDKGGKEWDSLLEEISICFLQLSQSKSAFKSQLAWRPHSASLCGFLPCLPHPSPAN